MIRLNPFDTALGAQQCVQTWVYGCIRRLMARFSIFPESRSRVASLWLVEACDGFVYSEHIHARSAMCARRNCWLRWREPDTILQFRRITPDVALLWLMGGFHGSGCTCSMCVEPAKRMDVAGPLRRFRSDSILSFWRIRRRVTPVRSDKSCDTFEPI